MMTAARRTGLAVIAATIASLSASAQTRVNPEAMAQVPASNPLSAEQVSTNLPEGHGVLERARPEYDAVGVPVGGMTLYPTLAADVTADDNIFRAPAATGDTVLTISPRLDLRSNWESSALQLFGQLDHYDYQDVSTETRTNWMLGGAGRLDQPGGFLSGAASFLDTHESRISPDLSLSALSPTRYKRVHSEGMSSGQFGAFTLSTELNYDRFDFDPTQLAGGGTIDNADRDRNVYQVTGRASYELVPEQAIFAQFTYERRDFDRLLDRNGFDRNSHGYRADIGTAMMLTPLIRATAYAGLLQQDYGAPFRDVSSMDFNVQIDWFATELLTAHFAASRIIDDTTISGASSVDVRRISASVDYELLRELILQPYINYYDDKFNGITRDDRIVGAGIEGRYLINNYLAAYASYTHQERATNATGRDFSDNMVTFGIRGQL